MFDERARRGWRQMLANQGISATLRIGVERLRSKLSRARGHTQPSAGRVHEPPAVHPFDRKYGTDTSGLIWGEHLPSGKRNDSWNTAYYGIAPSVFSKLMESLGIDYRAFSFVDFGSGKGRAVMLATNFPFREVIGIELAPELHAVAVENLAKYQAHGQQCGSARLLNMDATEFAFPQSPSVLYFNHPFCRPVLEQVIQNLGVSLQQHPREVRLIYINPETRKVLDTTPFLQLVEHRKFEMSPEDESADLMGTRAEEVVVYRNRF